LHLHQKEEEDKNLPKKNHESDSFLVKNPLDEFEGLWEVTEDQMPLEEEVQTRQSTSNLEEIIHQQNEEILYLKEINNLLLSEKESFLAKINTLDSIVSDYREIKRDYESVVYLNRKLTKQVNQINKLRQVELGKIKEICKILEK